MWLHKILYLAKYVYMFNKITTQFLIILIISYTLLAVIKSYVNVRVNYYCVLCECELDNVIARVYVTVYYSNQ